MIGDQNYAQAIRLTLHASQLVPMELHIDVVGTDGISSEEVQWQVLVDPTATWQQTIYAILAMIRKSKKDLPIEYTNAVFMIEPNRTSLLQE